MLLSRSWFVALFAFASVPSAAAGKKAVVLLALSALDVAHASVDWRNKGAVTPVKNQGDCDVGWAFAVVQTIESYDFIKTGSLQSHSVQNVLDCGNGTTPGCSTPESTSKSQKQAKVGKSSKTRALKGRKGSKSTTGISPSERLAETVERAYDTVKRLGGIGSESDYPYTAMVGTCKAVTPVVDVSGFTMVAPGEANLLTVVTLGPPLVVLNCASLLRTYTGGILSDDWDSLGESDNKYLPEEQHVVQVVGYGTSTPGDYWIVKNSWGSSW
eukprot:CAMPEP_0181028846 /NCGR_PEP_ID=MMETSP1070-20121207/4883_1 /TAXON_ID=265543 /ORGANISM="Minutocellus polymorphus, Strain NH13" /LENGTH=270 /DNA_ID=CAMNT_0023106117 /DNA_START=113 /DNA_END=922 /DNA_ORIENTATION=+